jgi:hypothetical protein
MWGLPHYVSECRRERETSARSGLTPCERAVVARDTSSPWISEGVIDVGPSGVLFAFSDLHGDVGLLKENLYNAGLIDRRFRWLMRHAVVVVCGDTIDDCRGATCGALETQMSAAGFDGDPGAPHGSNEWNMLMLIRYLTKQGARIVTLFGNHEVMRTKAQSGPYQRRVSAEYERRLGIDGWGAGSVMRTLLGEPLLMACAGNVLFLHADAPRQTSAPGGLEALVRECNRRFRRSIEVGGVDGAVNDALWGRRFGTHIDGAVCDELARTLPRVLVVRGHCINRGQSCLDGGVCRPFLMTGADKEALRERGVATARAARVGRVAHGRGEVFDGVTLACFGRDVARPYGGAVLRVDCGASYAFGGGRAGALVCILLSGREVSDVFCIAGAHRPPLE